MKLWEGRAKMKYIICLILFWVMPFCLWAAQMTVDGELDDWTAGNRCSHSSDNQRDVQPGYVSEPKTIDIRNYGGCLDFSYEIMEEKKYFGYIKAYYSPTVTNSLFNGETWSCYDYYLDSDETEGTGTTDHDFYHPEVVFSPSYRLRFCGNNNQIEEVRFQVWDGNDWIGESNLDQPYIDYTISEDKHVLEFSINKLDDVKIYNPMWRSPFHRFIFFAVLAWQNDWFDITNVDAVVARERNPLSIQSTSWQEIKVKQ